MILFDHRQHIQCLQEALGEGIATASSSGTFACFGSRVIVADAHALAKSSPPALVAESKSACVHALRPPQLNPSSLACVHQCAFVCVCGACTFMRPVDGQPDVDGCP
eukprot:4946438-Amphidinium_carterae.1